MEKGLQPQREFVSRRSMSPRFPVIENGVIVAASTEEYRELLRLRAGKPSKVRE